MEIKALDSLFCDKCEQAISIEKSLLEYNSEIILGILSCSCSIHPIVEGILVFHHEKKRDIINLLLESESHQVSERYVLDIMVGSQNATHILSSKSFSKLVYLLFDRTFADYLNYRNSCRSFFETIPFFPAMKCGMILDVGSGAGHFSKLLKEYFKTSQIISVDQNFLLLIIARKFFGIQNLVCTDINNSFPFATDAFDSVMCTDTFHYLDNKAFAASQLKRVVNDSGVLMVLHIHNYMQKNYFPGTPLNPKEYSNLFGRARMFPNDVILKDYFEDDLLDLSVDFSIDKLNICQTLSLIYSKKEDVFKMYNFISSFTFKESSTYKVNRIYSYSELGDNIFLNFFYPSLIYEKEHAVEESYLRREIKITKKDLSDKKKLRELMKCFVLLKNYEGQLVHV